MDQPQPVDGTGKGLVDFWGWVIEKGQMNSNTAGALRAACTQILAVQSEDLSSINVKQLDVEDLLRRFEIKRKLDFSPQSLATYKGRFRTAVDMYLGYLENPSGWRPTTRTRKRATPVRLPPRTTLDSLGATPPDVAQSLVEYPFPVRQGVIARLVLPVDLRKNEARRLSAFLESLAVEEQPALPIPADGAPTE